MRQVALIGGAALAATVCLFAGSTALTANSQVTTKPSVSGGACANLAALSLPDVKISYASLVAAGAVVPGANYPNMTGGTEPGPPVFGLPAFCRVKGSIHPEAGSDIRFEVWMPVEGWDGRFAGGNNGGLAGYISYMDLASGIRAGQAVASTDTGHVGAYADGTWAKGHPEKVRDYGWRAIHVTTVAAKKLVESFYGRGPDRSYFIGCSNGGRQALMEASRFPEDYDGVVAGAPAAVITDAAIAMANRVQALAAPGGTIRPEQVSLIQSEVLRQCDALDGQTDGLVADPRQCHFDSSKLACGMSKSAQCFSPQQIASVNRIHVGAVDRSGNRVVFGLPATGAEVGVPAPFFGWEGVLVTSGGGKNALADAIMTELAQKPVATSATFDFSRDPARLKAALSADLDVRPDLRRFFARGGKVIFWHGWADTALAPEGTISFYETMLRNSGPAARSHSRLFMVPGVQHCMGGPGADVLGQSGAPLPGDTPEQSLGAALKAWVEDGRTPETITGRRSDGRMMLTAETSKTARQRLICSYPAVPRLQLGADPDKASNYTCENPK